MILTVFIIIIFLVPLILIPAYNDIAKEKEIKIPVFLNEKAN